MCRGAPRLTFDLPPAAATIGLPMVLGNAQFGEVILCEQYSSAKVDPAQPERVAVKSIDTHVMQRRLAAGETSEDPMQEIEVYAKVRAAGNHPNIVACEDVRASNHVVELVMEFCDQGDLWTHLSKQPESRLDEQDALRKFEQVARGLDFLHREIGVAHRDLSPENVLLHDGECKIADFGLSISTTARPSDTVGKWYYMAPEVAAGREYDPVQADMWSLGVILFIMLTGAPLVERAHVSNKAFNAFCLWGLERFLTDWGMIDLFQRSTIDLCQRLLQVLPSARITMEEVLKHPALCR
ncbi:TPA: hypothetical protein N0F65_011527 [Lagenidium giganteum]|uniref:Protein kinase domain-containing protein n=1 Tax=Lagenidium giganteum TaxID=4803 RepID=A0AAV2Z2I1_9STRA|nr:TPA: hypothetical protein N0F65_011527 [Lagenidium giganteum]